MNRTVILLWFLSLTSIFGCQIKSTPELPVSPELAAAKNRQCVEFEGTIQDYSIPLVEGQSPNSQSPHDFIFNLTGVPNVSECRCRPTQDPVIVFDLPLPVSETQFSVTFSTPCTQNNFSPFTNCPGYIVSNDSLTLTNAKMGRVNIDFFDGINRQVVSSGGLCVIQNANIIDNPGNPHFVDDRFMVDIRDVEFKN